jgi:armadillo repeat-containing protein 8
MMDTLVVLSSRCQDPEIQLAASRCFTYIHRSGSINANDDRLIYKTIPCLYVEVMIICTFFIISNFRARLCSKDFEINIRAVAAETLAYLAEVK